MLKMRDCGSVKVRLESKYVEDKFDLSDYTPIWFDWFVLSAFRKFVSITDFYPKSEHFMRLSVYWEVRVIILAQ